jgi:hypothetical protein
VSPERVRFLPVTTDLTVLGVEEDLDQLRLDLATSGASFTLKRSGTSLKERQVDGQLELWALVVSFGVGVASNAAYDLVQSGIDRVRRAGRTSLHLQPDDDDRRDAIDE